RSVTSESLCSTAPRVFLLARSHGVVAIAGLNLVLLIFRPDLHLAERAVQLGIYRGIPDVVLAAQLLGYLVEGALQLLHHVSNFDHPPASFPGQFLHRTVA